MEQSERVQEFCVGQEGKFLIYDAFHEPIETIHGKIVQLMEGQESLYALIQTKRGLRPARLCRAGATPKD